MKSNFTPPPANDDIVIVKEVSVSSCECSDFDDVLKIGTLIVTLVTFLIVLVLLEKINKPSLKHYSLLNKISIAAISALIFGTVIFLLLLN